MNQPSLRSLAAKPFELLQEIERRARVAVAGVAENAGRNEWVGVGFSINGSTFVANRDAVGEVMMVPDAITRVPGAKAWLLGIANLRGQLLPLIDLSLLLGGARTQSSREVRVISVSHRDVSAGLMVGEVTGFRRFVDAEYDAQARPDDAFSEQFVAGCFVRSDSRWPVFAFDQLLQSQQFLQAAQTADT